MPVRYTQFGGFTGSYAGDCAVINVDQTHFCVIDAGRGSQGDNGVEAVCGKRPTRDHRVVSPAIPASLTLVASHFHDDHIARGNNWKIYRRLKAMFHCGAAATQGGQAARQAAANILPIGDVTRTPKIVFTGAGGDGFLAMVTSIAPHFKNTAPNLDENDASLASVIQVLHGTTLLWSCLSLGDMTPRSGNSSVTKLVQALQFKPKAGFDCVKLSHHGSSANFLPVVDGLISPATLILISGYTLKDTDKLITKLKQWKTTDCRMLFDSSINPVKELGASHVANLEAAGVSFERAYIQTWQ